MDKQETYISIDIETDGPCPGINSMLSLGACVFRLDEAQEVIGAPTNWYTTLAALPEGCQNSDTMKWWETQPRAWAELQEDPQDPEKAIRDFTGWINYWRAWTAPGKLVAVAWPAAFDFGFVNYYCWRYTGSNPLGFACADIRSYAAGLLGRPHYYGLPEAAINQIAGPKKSGMRPHHALDDAIEQADLMRALLRTAAGGVPSEG